MGLAPPFLRLVLLVCALTFSLGMIVITTPSLLVTLVGGVTFVQENPEARNSILIGATLLGVWLPLFAGALAEVRRWRYVQKHQPFAMRHYALYYGATALSFVATGFAPLHGSLAEIWAPYVGILAAHVYLSAVGLCYGFYRIKRLRRGGR